MKFGGNKTCQTCLKWTLDFTPQNPILPVFPISFSGNLSFWFVSSKTSEPSLTLLPTFHPSENPIGSIFKVQNPTTSYTSTTASWAQPAIIMSHLDHSNSLLTNGPASPSPPCPPQSSPHMFTRVIFLKHKSDQITPLLKTYRWLPSYSRVQTQVLSVASSSSSPSSLILFPTASPHSLPSSHIEPLAVPQTCQARSDFKANGVWAAYCACLNITCPPPLNNGSQTIALNSDYRPPLLVSPVSPSWES